MRRDLSFPQQVVQTAHAVIEVSRHGLIPFDREHPYVVVFGVRNEEQLINALRRISRLGINCKPFYESDLDGQITAFATEPVSGDSRRYFKNYQCLRDVHCVAGGAV